MNREEEERVESFIIRRKILRSRSGTQDLLPLDAFDPKVPIPPKRKPLEPADANVASSRVNRAKRSKTGKHRELAKDLPRTNNGHRSSQDDSEYDSELDSEDDYLNADDERCLATIKAHERHRWSKHSSSKDFDTGYLLKMRTSGYPNDFLCFCDPFDSSKSSGQDHEAAKTKRVKQGLDEKVDTETCPCLLPASDIPDHAFTMTAAGRSKYHVAKAMLRLRDPELCMLHTFKYHHAYGAMEVAQGLMLDFDEALKAEDTFGMWAVVEGMGLYMTIGQGWRMTFTDDLFMTARNAQQVLLIALAAFATLERKGLMDKDSKIQNIGWMVSIYDRIAEDFKSERLLTASSKVSPFTPGNFGRFLRAYIRPAGIVIPGEPATGEEEEANTALPPSARAKSPWNWKTKLAECKKASQLPVYAFRAHERKFGGDGLDISSWPGDERIVYNYMEDGDVKPEEPITVYL